MYKNRKAEILPPQLHCNQKEIIMKVVLKTTMPVYITIDLGDQAVTDVRYDATDIEPVDSVVGSLTSSSDVFLTPAEIDACYTALENHTPVLTY